MEELSIGLDFERPAARRDEGERLNALAQFEDLGRQTDGLGRVVSNYTIFDRYLRFHSSSFPTNRLSLEKGGSRRAVADMPVRLRPPDPTFPPQDQNPVTFKSRPSNALEHAEVVPRDGVNAPD